MKQGLFWFVVGISIASATFIRQAIGSKNYELGKIYYREIRKITLFITLITGRVLIVFPTMIMRILTDNLEVIKIGSLYLFVMGFTQIPQNLYLKLSGVFRGAGHTYFPMANAGIGICIIRVPLALNYKTINIQRYEEK
jgi:Na+-driven multidrug efflux pump